MKTKIKYLLVCASILLAVSCEADDTSQKSLTEKSMTPIVTFVSVSKSRTVETTTANLREFSLTSFIDGHDNYMDQVKYTLSSSDWKTDAGTFFWPMSGDLNFYAYAPVTPGQAGEVTINKDKQVLEGFTPKASAAEQQDFIYCKATGNLANNASSGVNLNFQHALSEITVSAKNENTAYSISVKGVRLGNIKNKGSFTFPAVSGSGASWTLADGSQNYETALASSVSLSSSATALGGSDATFMLIPQQLAKADKASSGSCLALNVVITSQGGDQIYSGWTYVGIDTKWEMNRHYTYTVDFTGGAGQKEDGTLVVSGKGISANVTVTPWEDKNIAIPELVDANSLILTLGDTKTAYGIDITRANTFWSNSDVGDASNVIGDDTEWIADVVWQDIPSRAINFCDASGNDLSGDTYSAKGKSPLYVKAAGSTPGNVVVGIKKKGSSDYLWSWHLWITEKPSLIAGFMDRNLGATSANPSDGSKTYGLYYQFGRKDPFVGSVDIYDINGTKLQTGATIGTGKVTFAKAVNTPGTFYTYGSSNGDWASPNNYTDKRWNDITDASGKTFFDPCPPGWKLPEKTAFSGFSTSTFTWDATNRGRTYNTNWFPAAGYRFYGSGSVSGLGSSGVYWGDSPYDESCGYDLSFISGFVYPQDDVYRAFGPSGRCVQE